MVYQTYIEWMKEDYLRDHCVWRKETDTSIEFTDKEGEAFTRIEYKTDLSQHLSQCLNRPVIVVKHETHSDDELTFNYECLLAYDDALFGFELDIYLAGGRIDVFAGVMTRKKGWCYIRELTNDVYKFHPYFQQMERAVKEMVENLPDLRLLFVTGSIVYKKMYKEVETEG